MEVTHWTGGGDGGTHQTGGGGWGSHIRQEEGDGGHTLDRGKGMGVTHQCLQESRQPDALTFPASLVQL